MLTIASMKLVLVLLARLIALPRYQDCEMVFGITYSLMAEPGSGRPTIEVFKPSSMQVARSIFSRRALDSDCLIGRQSRSEIVGQACGIISYHDNGNIAFGICHSTRCDWMAIYVRCTCYRKHCSILRKGWNVPCSMEGYALPIKSPSTVGRS